MHSRRIGEEINLGTAHRICNAGFRRYLFLDVTPRLKPYAGTLSSFQVTAQGSHQ